MPSSSINKTHSPTPAGAGVGDKPGPSRRERCFLWLEVAAFVAYVVGGVGTLAGLAVILLADQRDLGFWGQGRSLGLLLVCLGLCLSVAGVLLVRYFRNRQWV